ncbi:hypothetical protein U9M48_030780 [Paspalum notatum var. saurae]|uniref:Uncharacterized protein n=1 Tax=Paspalum notatum var. saurae TaxID=547442 RepID=A0AAQ3X2M3_PASNO
MESWPRAAAELPHRRHGTTSPPRSHLSPPPWSRAAPHPRGAASPAGRLRQATPHAPPSLVRKKERSGEEEERMEKIR